MHESNPLPDREVVSDFALPYPVPLRGSRIARGLLGLLGWRVLLDGLPGHQGVLVVYPHTSNWDFVVLVLAKWSVGLQASFWGKDSLFKVPLFGRWLRWLGGVPVLRHAPRGTVGQAVDILTRHKQAGTYFWLALSPEGTRRRTAGWRSGFYQAAVAAGVPLGVVSLDFSRKCIDARAFLALSGNAEADFVRIRHILQGVQGHTPHNAAPVQLIER